MSLKEIARATLAILDQGGFVAENGAVINFAAEQKQAEKGTILYRPEPIAQLFDNMPDGKAGNCPIVVTDETTQVAAHRLVKHEACKDLVLLNFASARNPGGGFINGAKAQEEDLARCSGLYRCLLQQPEYYDVNRAQESLLYTEHLIYAHRG